MRASRGSSSICATKSELQREDNEKKTLPTTSCFRIKRLVSSPTQFRIDSVYFNAHLTDKFSGTPAPPKQFIQRVNFKYNKSNLVCRYCKKLRHLVDKCYKLHGFPPDFKFTKGKKIISNVEVQGLQNSAGHQNSAEVSHSPSDGSSDSESIIPGLTKDKYSQLRMLLQQTQISESQPHSSLMASANFAGPFTENTNENW
nr:uncharacterized protein LOC117277237 [Nicotiana tomentosiformis]